MIVLSLKIDQAYSFADIVSLTVSSGPYNDQTIVRLENQSTYNFDSNWDAYKLSNSGKTPNLFTSLNGINYSINSIPGDSNEFSIPLDLKVAFTGNYLITVKSIKNSYDSTLTITLEDRFLNQIQVLQENTSYSFAVVLGDAPNRFVLHYKRKVSTLVTTIPTTEVSTSYNDSIPSTVGTTTSNNDTIPLTEYTDPSSNDLVSGVAPQMDESQVDLITNYEGITVNFNNTQSAYSSIDVITSEGQVIYHEESIPNTSSHQIKLNSFIGGNIYIVRVIQSNGILNKKINF
jgi:hypothetical protein